MSFFSKTKDFKLNNKLQHWRVQAGAWFSLCILWVIASPFMAMYLQYQITPDLVEGWLATFSIAHWPLVYMFILVAVFLLIEIISWSLIGNHSMNYPEYIDTTIGKLAQKAGLAPIPRVIYVEGSGFLNAGAMRSFIYGRKIILFGNIRKLSQEQLEAVLAHEMAHLMMRDVWFSQFARAMLISVKTVNRLTFLAMTVSIFMSHHDLTWFLAGTFIVTGLGSLLARSCYMKYSRICEYRADAIAAHLTSKAHRQHLIDALKVVREMSLIAVLKKSELKDIDSGTHPTIRNRAKALGVKLVFKNSV